MSYAEMYSCGTVKHVGESEVSDMYCGLFYNTILSKSVV
jgi:hypothetical protein